MKYILKKYPGMELDKKKFLIKKAMKKHLEKGTIKQVKNMYMCSFKCVWTQEIRFAYSCFVFSPAQLKGKGLLGTFTIGKQLPLSKVC